MNKQIIFKLITVFISVYINNAQAASISVDMVPGGVINGSLTIPFAPPPPDSTFDVDILINDVADLAGFQFDLGFDPLILAASSIDSGNIFGADTFPLDSSINGDFIRFSEITVPLSGLNISVQTILATIHFKAIGIGTSALELKNTELLDSAADPIPSVILSNGQITSQAPPVIQQAPEPSSVLLLGLGLLGLISIKKV